MESYIMGIKETNSRVALFPIQVFLYCKGGVIMIKGEISESIFWLIGIIVTLIVVCWFIAERLPEIFK